MRVEVIEAGRAMRLEVMGGGRAMRYEAIEPMKETS
jgi:hypothetical protein